MVSASGGTTEWCARNPVAANLVMGFIVVSGVLAGATVTTEVFPEVALDRIRIDVPYLGAAPDEVERGVVVRVEEAIYGIDGIETIRSTASEGMASVTVDLELGADVRRVVDEVKSNVDAIATFPIETEKPIIRELVGRFQVIDVVISGPADSRVLKTLAERVRDGLTALPEITQADIVGAPPYEISIEVSETALRRHRLTFDQVADAVRGSSLDLPGGSVQTDRGQVLLRTVGQAYRGEEYADLTLWTRSDGSRLRLGDVASVVDGFAETDHSARFDGAPAVMVSVFRSGAQSALDISAATRAYVEEVGPRLPEGVSLALWQDQAVELRERLSLMARNGIAGFVLVLAVLALFLEVRLALWVSLGIPISFLGAVALMPALGVSLNTVSLFAFIIVLGILVDDAIVVGENVYRHQETHGDNLRGAVDGAREVAVPVVFAVLTSAAAFLPMLFVPGMMGKIFRVVPLVIIPCLLISLVESFGILPAHLAHRWRRPPGPAGPWERVRGAVADGLRWLMRAGYQPLLVAALRWRYLTVAIGLSMLILTAGMFGGGWIRFQFFPPADAGIVTASVTMPQGTAVDVTAAAVAQLERGAERLRAELLDATGVDQIQHVATTIGDQPMVARSQGPLFPRDMAAPHVGEATIELTPAEGRRFSSEQVGGRWRELTGPIPEAVEVRYVTSLITAGQDIDVQLAGPDLDSLRVAASEVRGALGGYAGVYAITDSFRAGTAEMQLGIKPAAEMLGLTLRDLGRQVRQAFYGEEAQRIQRGRDDVRVMVRYPRDKRRSLGDMENMRIRTPAGDPVPFSQVARVEPRQGFASITRVDRYRAVNVTASVDPAVSSSGAVIADLRARILPRVVERHPGVFYTFEGIEGEQAETVEGLSLGFVLALFLIFTLLAVPLRSYSQPLIIMSAIPFGLIGAVWGHVITGLDVTLLSLFGLVALTGVVVNDSLVMVDFINQRRQDLGGDLHEAVRAAGAARFRPILLTSLTTFAGLTPLMWETGFQAQFLVPMAVSLAFGVLFATFITLLLVPTIYLILDDVVRLRWTSGGRALLRGRRAGPG